jgi:hypothetical protein
MTAATAKREAAIIANAEQTTVRKRSHDVKSSRPSFYNGKNL